MSIYENKKVLVTGGTGMIGRPLVEMLTNQGAKVRIASLDDASQAHPSSEFFKTDLRIYDNCREVCEGMDYVFHLAGIKGSPKITTTKPASFMVPMMLFNTNMMEGAFRAGVEKYLYTSSVGVYSPAEVFYEDDVWKTFPSENDRFSGWAKRMGELQAEAYKVEHGWKDITIVRPANVYGPFDNFHPETSMVIPALIKRVADGENPLTVWGDGTPIRDFVYTDDVARGILFAMDKGSGGTFNLGSGNGMSIKELVTTLQEITGSSLEVFWDKEKPNGDKKRILDMSRIQSLGFRNEVSLKDGLTKTLEWYKDNKEITGGKNRYDAFTK
ncbi:MAG: NAD-dependent epimerase/dehydratase family protein [Halobacteriovoraceae bacterium]|nr:NAD-dependent epimerase/dehydratase family protein [Halobacteriovoraceae bacterium]